MSSFLFRLSSPPKDSEQFFICKTSSWSQLYFYVCAPAVLSVISAHHSRLFAKGIGTLGLCKTNAITLPLVVLHTKLADKRHGLPKIIPENIPGDVCQIELRRIERTPRSTKTKTCISIRFLSHVHVCDRSHLPTFSNHARFNSFQISFHFKLFISKYMNISLSVLFVFELSTL